MNQQCVGYKFKCDLCDGDYVGYTRRHLFQRTEEHKHSAIGKHSSLNIPISTPPRSIRSSTLNRLKGLVFNRPYSDSRYWTGTSFQLRLMQDANDVNKHSPV